MSEQDDMPRISYLKIALVIVAALVLVLILTALIVILAPFETSVSVTLVGTVTSTVLSAILAYFYLTMRDIQEQQTKITSSQNEIARAAQQPRLLLQEWSMTGNTISAKLSNLGEGIATNITVTICVQPIDVRKHYELISHHPIEEHRLVVGKKSAGRKYIDSNILEAGEKNAEFEAEVQPVNCFIIDEEPDGLIPPNYLFSQLKLKGPKHVIVSVVVSHNDILGSTHHNTIWEVAVEYSGESSIEALLSKEAHELERANINLIEPANAPDRYDSTGDELLYN